MDRVYLSTGVSMHDHRKILEYNKTHVQGGQMLKLRKQQNDFEKQQKAAFATIKSSKKRSRNFLLKKWLYHSLLGKSVFVETSYISTQMKKRAQILDFEAMFFS
jgi:hypothetical protein